LQGVGLSFHNPNSIFNCDEIIFIQDFLSINASLTIFLLICIRIIAMGESTLGDGGQICCHNCIVFKEPCLNFNHVIIMKDFTIFLHIMVGQNPNKSNSKETTFLNLIWCDGQLYLCQKYRSQHIEKCKYIQKRLKWFLVFMKFVVSTKHCDSIWLE
jgi:hypothetical protein